MTRQITVTIADVSEPDEESGLDLLYVVRNGGERSIWLVDDDQLVWREQDDRIELSFARAPLSDEVEPFGYFRPDVRELQPDESVEKAVRLRWPQSVSTLWNETSKVEPDPGTYELRVRVGYGEEPEPDSPGVGDDVDSGVLAWQREAVSDPVSVRIEEYSST